MSSKACATSGDEVEDATVTKIEAVLTDEQKAQLPQQRAGGNGRGNDNGGANGGGGQGGRGRNRPGNGQPNAPDGRT